MLMVILAFSLLVATPVQKANAGAGEGFVLGGVAGAVFGALGICPLALVIAIAEDVNSGAVYGYCVGITATLLALLGSVTGLGSHNQSTPPTEMYASNSAFQLISTSPKVKKPPLFFVKDLTKVRNGKVEPGFGVGINLLAIGRD